MESKISKEFRWEMSHRLVNHEGECKNIHGHSYKLYVELKGNTNGNGMLIDFYDMEKIVEPVLQKLDHSFICDGTDSLMLDFLNKNDFKHVVLENPTTAENIADYLLDILVLKFKSHSNLKGIKLRLYESDYAYVEAVAQL